MHWFKDSIFISLLIGHTTYIMSFTIYTCNLSARSKYSLRDHTIMISNTVTS